VTGHVLDALNQPIVFVLLLVGTGGFLIAGELQTIARGFRRTAGRGGATTRATSSGSPALGRRYRLTLLVGAGLLLFSAFGTTSASFSQQNLFGRMKVDVDLPATASSPAATDTPAPAATDTPTLAPTLGPTLAPTDAPTTTPTDAPTAAPTATPTLAPTDAPTDTPTDAPVQ